MKNYRIVVWFERGIDTEHYTVQRRNFFKFWTNVYTFQNYMKALKFVSIMFRIRNVTKTN